MNGHPPFIPDLIITVRTDPTAEPAGPVDVAATDDPPKRHGLRTMADVLDN